MERFLLKLFTKIIQNFKAILLFVALIPYFPSEEFLNGIGFLVFVAAIILNYEAQRGCETRTDYCCRGPRQVNSAILGTEHDETGTNNVTTDVQVISTTDDNARLTRSEDVTREEGPDLDRLPLEIFGRILGRLSYECRFQLKSVSKKLKSLVESSQSHEMVQKVKLTAPYFFIENGHWQWAGYDLFLNKWRRMPTLDLNFLPADCRPDPDLFKEYLVCSAHGLLCINFSKSPGKERLIVLNPMSRMYRELPPMTCRRNPVFMHMLVEPASQYYQVIAAGSSKSGNEDLSRVTEVYDSRTKKWERTGDFPGPAYALNEFQTGVYKAGKVFCIGFVEDNDQVSKGILGYDVEEGAWSTKWTHKFSPCILKSTILQLVEQMGEIFLFSERENGQFIDRLDWTSGDEKNTSTFINIVHKEKLGGRSLEVYPQSVCVPFSDDHLCILDAIDHTGVVHDIWNQDEFALEALPEQGFTGELGFFSLNAMSFIVEPNFEIKV